MYLTVMATAMYQPKTVDDVMSAGLDWFMLVTVKKNIFVSENTIQNKEYIEQVSPV